MMHKTGKEVILRRYSSWGLIPEMLYQPRIQGALRRLRLGEVVHTYNLELGRLITGESLETP